MEDQAHPAAGRSDAWRVCSDLHSLRAIYGLFATLDHQKGVLENGAHTAISYLINCNNCVAPVDESMPKGHGMFVAIAL
jgi:hypothetical protein